MTMTAASVPALAWVVFATLGIALLFARSTAGAQGRGGPAAGGRHSIWGGAGFAIPAALAAAVILGNFDALGAVVAFAVVSALALRGFLHSPAGAQAGTRVRILFLCIPLQYALVAAGSYALLTLALPLGAALALPLLAVLGRDWRQLDDRVALRYWALMLLVYGLSHAPAVLLLELPGFPGRNGLLVMFLVAVTLVAAGIEAAMADRVGVSSPRRRAWTSLAAACVAGAFIGAAVAPMTPFPLPATSGIGAIVALAAATGQRVLALASGTPRVSRWEAVSGPPAALCFAAPLFFHALRALAT